MPNNTTEAKIAWLAGIIDGEGSIIVNSGRQLLNRITLTNTDKELLQECIYILDALEISYGISHYIPKQKVYHKDQIVCGTKEVFIIEIGNLRGVIKLGSLLEPYLFSAKKLRIQHLIATVQQRLNKPRVDGKGKNMRKCPYLKPITNVARQRILAYVPTL